MSKKEFYALVEILTQISLKGKNEDPGSKKAKSACDILATSIESWDSEKWKELMTIIAKSYSIGHSSRIIATIVAALKINTDNSWELYLFLDTGCSGSLIGRNRQ